MRSSTRRRWKWLLICTVAAVVVAIAWIAVEKLRPPLIRSQTPSSAAIGYGTLRESTKHPKIVINEIWKRSSSDGNLAVGDVIAVPAAAARAGADGFIVFFKRPWFSHGPRLRVSAIVAVYHGRVPSEDISISEAKALCVATPSI